MEGGLHAQTLYTQRNEEMSEDQVAGKRDQDKTEKEFFVQGRKQKPMYGSGGH